MITSIQHFSFTVSDINEAIRFFRDTLGFRSTEVREVRGERMDRIHMLKGASLLIANIIAPQGGHIELLQFNSPKGKKIDPMTNNPGIAHMAFVVDDIQTTYEELRAKGVKFNCPPIPIVGGALDGWNGCYFRGVDDITFELMQPPRGVKTDPVTGFVLK